MKYNTALLKAWLGLENATQDKKHSLLFLTDEYSVDLAGKSILSLSCNVPAKPYLSILILHYIMKRLNGLPELTGEWISFKQLSGGEGYYPAFKKRVIETIVQKYKDTPDTLLKLVERFKAKTTQTADFSLVLDTFDNVPILINFWKGDEEFGPEANVLFDKSITGIFCTEDIVVLSEIVAHSI